MVDLTFERLTMPSVALFEAKTRLSELLVQAQQGEVITITRHGVPMARLVAAEAIAGDGPANTRRQKVDAAFSVLASLRQGVTLDVPLKEAISAGRD
jgi:prevent-host-death family protein